MTIPPIQPGPASASAPTRITSAPSDASKIEQSAQQFESMLVREVLADTFKPTSPTGGAASPGADIYQGFVTNVIADHISQGGALGISHLLQSQLQASPKHSPSFRPAV